MNRFKGLNPVDLVPEKLWMEVHNILQNAVIKTIPQIKEMQEGKIVIWEGLTNRLKKKQKAKEKRKDILIWMQSSKEKQGEIRKPSSVNNSKNRGKQHNGKR